MAVQKKIKFHSDVINYLKELHFIICILEKKLNA